MLAAHLIKKQSRLFILYHNSPCPRTRIDSELPDKKAVNPDCFNLLYLLTCLTDIASRNPPEKDT